MSKSNPTPLRVGATGTLGGWRMRVAGRIVMSMELEGETYYWQEFYLVDGFGRSATLVHEGTEDGIEWKLFKPFEPVRPLTRAEAEAKRAGESVNLDGNDSEITLVDQSRVYHIDGVAPEGVEVGDVANYFNVDRGEQMLVVSWTGDEVEYYEGHDVPADQVAKAFGFPAEAATSRPTLSFRGDDGRGASSGSGLVWKIVGIVLLLIIGFAVFSCNFGNRSVSRGQAPAPPVKQAAPALRLVSGARGMLQQRNYVVAQRGTVEIARVGRRHDRHEYLLSTDGNVPALLIHALNGNPREWHLFEPLAGTALDDMNGYRAATYKKGTPVPVGSRTLRVTDLFQSKTLSSDGAPPATPWQPLQYGFVANEANEWLLARWTEQGIAFHQGRPIPEREVLDGLGKK